MELITVFVYCNPTSGGNQARKLLELPNQQSSFMFDDAESCSSILVKIYDLKTDASRLEGFDELKKVKDTGSAVRAVAAGGDGTVKWVISELVRIKAIDVSIGVIPFGTGNDMARILGWGASAPNPLIGGDDMQALKKIIRDLVIGQPIDLDVWKVETKVDEGTGRFDVAVKGEIVERKDKAKVVVDHMINYCSFGQDARAVFGFERHRRTSQFMNKMQFAIEGAKLTFQGRNLTCKSLTLNGKEIDKVSDLHGVIFQNIPSYAAGSDFWNATAHWTPGDERVPQLVGDGLLESHGLGHISHIGVHKSTLGMSDATSRLGQASDIVVKFDKSQKPVYFQVDGEPARLVDPTSCEISIAFRVKMVCRNDALLVLLKSLPSDSKEKSVVRSAFLLKARKNKRDDVWRNRFVALVKRDEGKTVTLEWYTGDSLRKRIDLMKDGKAVATVEKIDHGGPRPNTCFSVQVGNRARYFATESQEERDLWIHSFNETLIVH